MSSKNNSIVSGNSSSTKYYEDSSALLKGAVVLCQHGLLGNEDTINPLFDNLKSNVLRKQMGCEFCDGVLRYSELSTSNSTIAEIVSRYNASPTHNFFVRTLFSQPRIGAVTTQAAELKEMITIIRNKLPNVIIVLVGYSKGGVVNCKCAIDNPGLIDKIVNVGTPHTDTLVQDFIQFLGNTLKKKYNAFEYIPNPIASVVIQTLVDSVNAGFDNILDEIVTYKNLKKEWNNLSVKPKFTPIAGEAIVINGEYNGDFVVPTESAIAEGFSDRTYIDIIDNFIVTDDRFSVTTASLFDVLTDFDFILDILESFYDGIKAGDGTQIIECLFDIMRKVINVEGNFIDCLKLAHTSLLGSDEFLLTHNTVGMRVLAGLNA